MRDKENKKSLFAELLEQEDKRKETLKDGETVEGTVIRVDGNRVAVDIGAKSEGFIDISEFVDIDGEPNVKVGDRVEVYIEHIDRDGSIRISKERADKLKVWDELSRIHENGEIVEGKILQPVKGGYTVMIKGNVKAFLPGSQVDVKPVKDEKVVGQKYRFKIIKFHKKRNNIVLSRRAIIEEELERKRAEVLANLQEGAVVNGVVKNVTEYGAFIDLGGVDGLLHVSDISWGRLSDPRTKLKSGQEVKVVVLKFDPEGHKVSLGMKQLSPNPWETAEERYAPGTVVRGRVISTAPYGAFVELEEGIEGLIHVSEISWTKRIKDPSDVLKVGAIVEAVVLDIDVENTKISLSMKQLEPNPYELLPQKYPIGSVVKGRVRNVAEFGLFVEIEEGIDGLVHVSDISWIQKVRHPSELYKPGDEVEAVVLNIDFEHDRPKISLGIKQLTPDPWESIPQKYPIGSVVEGKILKVLDFGAFVELEEGIEGLVRVSETSDERVEDPRDVLEAGQTVKVKVIGIDPSDRRISLSIRGAQHDETVQGAVGGSNPTLGDIFKEALGSKLPEDE